MQKKTVAVVILLFISIFPLYGEKLNHHFAGLKTGYSLIHDYNGRLDSGINLGLGFEPALLDYVNIDILLNLYIFWKKDTTVSIARGGYSYCHVPSIAIGPRYTLPFSKRIKPFAGAGIHLTVAIDHDPARSITSASFGPGVYAKTGVDWIIGKSLFLGLESKYKWCFTDVPHIFSFNMRVGYRY